VADGNVPAKPRRYATGPAWSDAELAALFDLYPKAKRAVVEAAIPARAWGNIIAQANVRGVRRDVHFWSAAQEERLREMWPDCGRRSITRAVGHGWGGVLQCARRLGLRGRTVRAQPQTNTSGAVKHHVEGAQRWAGYVSTERASQATGYSRGQLATILAAYAEHFATLPSVERAVLPSPLPVIRGRASKCTHRVIELEAVINAATWWDSLETQATAARRLGVCHSTLSYVMGRTGLRLPKRARRPPQWWDDIVAMHGPKRKVTR
jgi:hypothetical protein